MRIRFFSVVALLGALVGAAPTASARAAIVADAAYVVGAIPLPIVNSADVAVVGASIVVGQGSFGAGNQSIVRQDPNGGFFTIVTNLNAIGAIVYDAPNDRLLFTDNAGELPGATTGDTIYALPNPRGVIAPVNADTLKLLPNGSIPFAQAVLPLANGDILIGDAAGPGNGRVVKLSGGVPTNFITGLDYTSGVSLAVSGNELLIGNVDGTFTGNVRRYSLAGAVLGTLATGLSGSYDQVVDAAGNVLLTGGFTEDFSSSTVVSIAPGGAIHELAHGFDFSSGMTIDGPTGQVMVLDFGQTRIDTLTPIDGLTPGGFGSKECNVEAFGGAPERSKAGKPRTRWTCTDGDPACDRDGLANGSCVFWVSACFSVADPRITKCAPAAVDAVTVTSKRLPAAAADVAEAANAVLPAAGAVCSQTSVVTVTADRKNRTMVFDASAAGKRVDKDTLKLRCVP
jgi:hypothetical protein